MDAATTSEEREDLYRVLLSNFFYSYEDPAVMDLADAVLAAGFRRAAPTDETPNKVAVEALVVRFDWLRNSGVCSPTTRGLLDDAERLMRGF